MSNPIGEFLTGLVGDQETPGFTGGVAFRHGLQDRKRKLALQNEDVTYERARRLREDVGFQLQQEHRGKLTAAAAQIRQQYGSDPRYKGITALPDDELVHAFSDLTTHPERFSRAEGSTNDLLYNEPGQPVGLINRGTHEMAPVTSGGKPVVRPFTTPAERRQDLGSVERQIDDTRADLARTEREVPPPFGQLPTARRMLTDSAAYEASRVPDVRRVGDLRQRADSLSTVRDSLAARVQGRPFTRPRGRGAPDNILQDLGRRFNWDEGKIRAELMRLGYDPES
jgi:hypothetical protein